MAESLDRRIALQQEQARLFLDQPNNALVFYRMLEWFAQVCDAERGDKHMLQLDHWASEAARLGVLSLVEHRAAVSGAFTAALNKEFPDLESPDVLLPVDKGALLRRLEGDALSVALTSINMRPPELEMGITHERQIDWLWMAWAVSRQEPILRRLTRLAARQDEVGRAVVARFELNDSIPRIQAAAASVRRHQAPRSTHQLSGAQAYRDIQELVLEVTKSPLWARGVWLIEFKNDRYYVVTESGITPPDTPPIWCDRPVEVREPTRQERFEHAKLKELGQEP